MSFAMRAGDLPEGADRCVEQGVEENGMADHMTVSGG